MKSKPVVIFDPRYADHDTGPGHPEQPARVKVVAEALRKAPFGDQLTWVEPIPCTDQHLLSCHTQRYLDAVRHDVAAGKRELSTGDTTICGQSLDVSLLAAGGAVLGVDKLCDGVTKSVFCAARPPGHHARPAQGMGFCLWNNAAIAARHAQKKHAIGKVLIVDWDVHHGNGAQDIFYDDPTVFYFSTHQSPWYPGTGAADETGTGKGLGTIMNAPLAAGAARKEVFAAFTDQLLAKMDKFRPELVIISAGFDSRIDDPLGQFRLTDDDFADLTRMMIRLADSHADGRVLSVLEGGYNLDGLAKAATAHVGALASR